MAGYVPTGSDLIVIYPRGPNGSPGALEVIITLDALITLVLTGGGVLLPTSSAGLPSGALFNNAGFVCVVP